MTDVLSSNAIAVQPCTKTSCAPLKMNPFCPLIAWQFLTKIFEGVPNAAINS